MLSSNRIPFSQRAVLRGLRQNIGRIDNDFVRIIVNGGRNPKKRLMGTLKSTIFEATTACAIVPTLTFVPSFVPMPGCFSVVGTQPDCFALTAKRRRKCLPHISSTGDSNRDVTRTLRGQNHPS